MAVMKPTPKDVGTYEAKLIGVFTQRQIVCLACGLVPCILISVILKTIGADGYTIAAFCILIMIIPGFLAFGSKICYGMKPEDFVIEYYQYHIKSKNIRLYETATLDDKLDIIRQKELKKEEKRLGIKNKPEKDALNKNNSKAITKVKFKDQRFKEFSHKESKEYKAFL